MLRRFLTQPQSDSLAEERTSLLALAQFDATTEYQAALTLVATTTFADVTGLLAAPHRAALGDLRDRLG